MALGKRGILAIRRAFAGIVSFPYCTAPVGAVARSNVACPESAVVAPIRPSRLRPPVLFELFYAGRLAEGHPDASVCEPFAAGTPTLCNKPFG